MATNAHERRCEGTNRRGERCAVKVVNAAGYCVAHDPDRPADMRDLGRRSGEARRRPNPDRVNESLRTYLQREVAPAEHDFPQDSRRGTANGAREPGPPPAPPTGIDLPAAA